MTESNPAMSGAVGTAVAAIGALPDIGGFALAGVLVCLADTTERAADAWEALPNSVGIVILSASAAEGLGEERVAQSSRLTVVMPP
jgi:vacuolar-type H+-ATPase subunit F/Vma7